MPASSASVHLYPIPPSIPQPGLPTGLKIVSRSTETRASNAARAALVGADVTPTGYRVGKFSREPCALCHGSRRPTARGPGGTVHLLAAGEDCSRDGL